MKSLYHSHVRMKNPLSVRCKNMSCLDITDADLRSIMMRLVGEHLDWSPARVFARACVEHMKGARE